MSDPPLFHFVRELVLTKNTTLGIFWVLLITCSLQTELGTELCSHNKIKIPTEGPCVMRDHSQPPSD